MRRAWVFAGIGTLSILLFGSAFSSIRSVAPKLIEPWKVGYWIWAGDAPAPAKRKVEILYVQVQGKRWPADLPEADSYFAVRRIDPGKELTRDFALQLAVDYADLLHAAGDRTPLTGLQIDYDCPTSRLRSYANFLGWVREALPSATRLSITALLDWFSQRTAISAVLAPVDEFVPQFYDTGSRRTSFGIAEPIDAVKWAPVLNALKTPYRIGISSFGRIARRRSTGSGESTVQYFRDATPLDFAGLQGLRRSTATTPAGEFVVRYDVDAPIEGNEDLLTGDVVEITFPTDAAVRAAYEAARSFGGYCAGVIFFRWPSRSETLALTSDEIARVLSGGSLKSESVVETRDSSCIERLCSDIYLHLGRDFSPADRLIRIRGLGSIEMFLPAGPLFGIANRRNQILVRIPAYSGLEFLYVGRAISVAPISFEVENP